MAAPRGAQILNPKKYFCSVNNKHISCLQREVRVCIFMALFMLCLYSLLLSFCSRDVTVVIRVRLNNIPEDSRAVKIHIVLPVPATVSR